ncbi:hypothetical protein [Gilliamella sp. Nev3-1]|uniref:hypothetical protein n=1 Tax=Gilliamella sp. Nev3-1 TaxID=3120250 RepID=UPI00080DB5D9|nr:hypothetical protein [Gilliamella apicola]OCG56979.1 hypothetical protein A9G40_00765 [Gilliamella apicola]
MIILTIEEREDENVYFKAEGIDTSTDMEKSMLGSVLELINNNFDVDKTKLEQENGAWNK